MTTPAPRGLPYERSAPRLLPEVLISDHDFIDRARLAAGRLAFTERRRAPAEFLKRQCGRRSKAGAGTIVDRNQIYAQRGEAYALVLGFFIDHSDWRNGETGRWEDGRGFVERYDVDQVARATRLGRDRVERAISDLVAGGILWRHQPREWKEGLVAGERRGWHGYVAITKLTIALWTLLGLEKERQEKIRKEREERERLAKLEEHAARAAAAAAAAVHGPSEPWPTYDYLTPAELKRFKARAFELAQENPGWTFDQVNAQALEDLGLRPPPLPPDEFDE